MKRVLGIALVLLGLVVGVLGTLSGTAWKPSQTLKASTVDNSATVLLLPPNVRSLLGSDVTVTVEPGSTGALLVGAHHADLQLWLKDRPYALVKGLKNKKTLALEEIKGSEPVENFKNSDLWISEREINSDLTIHGKELQPYRDLTMMLVSDGKAPAPKLILSWPQEASTPFFIPGIIGGILLIILGVVVLVEDARRRRWEKRRAARRARRAERLAQLEAQTAVIPKVSDEQLAAAALAEKKSAGGEA